MEVRCAIQDQTFALNFVNDAFGLPFQPVDAPHAANRSAGVPKLTFSEDARLAHGPLCSGEPSAVYRALLAVVEDDGRKIEERFDDELKMAVSYPADRISWLPAGVMTIECFGTDMGPKCLFTVFIFAMTRGLAVPVAILSITLISGQN